MVRMNYLKDEYRPKSDDHFTDKFWKFTLPVLIMTQKQKYLFFSLKRCRIKFIMLIMGRRLLRSFTHGQILKKLELTAEKYLLYRR